MMISSDHLSLLISWLSTCSDVRGALEEYGSFVAVYDKVSSELNNRVLGVVKELFDLHTEIKAQNICEKLYIGYVGELPNIQIHESLGIENATTLEGVQSFTNLMWPSGNYKFWYHINL
ncbi:unnamed protein product [Ilex paraguariensis]|uniref:Uncharacterized protein n=1 Tax=Ilex paraguariensis TaxID=185542 RepID=A0ABC8S809_9AQUA